LYTIEELDEVDENVDLDEVLELSRNIEGSKSLVNNSNDTSYNNNLLASLRLPVPHAHSTPLRPISSPLPAEPALTIPEALETALIAEPTSMIPAEITKTSTEMKAQLMESLKSSTNATRLLYVLKELELGGNFDHEWKRHKSEFIDQFLNDIISLKVIHPITFLNGWSKELMLIDIKKYLLAKEREEREEREGNLARDASSIISNQDQSERGM
jgi:hypothetical protein